MLTVFEVMFLFMAVIVVLLLIRNQQMKEVANGIAKRFCQQNNLQFLDGTVALGTIRPDKHFPMLLRQYRFEYSIDKVHRHIGSVSLIGRHTQSIYVDPDHLDNTIHSVPG
ncbi:MAG: DUF3301 domain-containing protein [Gammaproteobacteria bacterium]|nr:DUF3301 domain-containing protein [Gammaproteobacteria bacterium]